MNKELVNICPICEKRNSILNEKCYNCGFEFGSQEQLYYIKEDGEAVLHLLVLNIQDFINEKDSFNDLLDGKGKEEKIINHKNKAIKIIKEVIPYFNNSYLLYKYLSEQLEPSSFSNELKKLLTGSELENIVKVRNELINFLAASETESGRKTSNDRSEYELSNFYIAILNGLKKIKEDIVQKKILNIGGN